MDDFLISTTDMGSLFIIFQLFSVKGKHDVSVHDEADTWQNSLEFSIKCLGSANRWTQVTLSWQRNLKAL